MMKKTFILFTVFLIAANVFGLNKIRVKDMDWRIYETEHFKIYYYENEEFLAKIAAIYAEEAYARNTVILKASSKSRIPLFIYENPLDFSSTNITLSFLGEGTGGFTESFKNRVVVPSDGSLKSFREVIYHEVTHALQFNILFGEGIRSYNALYKEIFVPLWVMEGQAEYCADDLDSEGEMVLRDAVLNDRIIPVDRLEGFVHLEEVYLAYKEAQSIMDYIAVKYGDEKISKIIHMLSDELALPVLFKKMLNKTIDEFGREWEFHLKKKYWAQAQGRDIPSKYGPRITEAGHKNIIHNQAPSFSPDGSRIAFLSNRDGYRSVFVMRPDGKEIKKVFSVPFEGVSTGGFPISWAADNRTIYFSSIQRGRRYIFKGDVETGNLDKIDLKEMYNVYSPAVSPGGTHIAFIGVEGGFSDVYLAAIDGSGIKNITENVFMNSSVSWSPDGRRLVFTEERNDHDRIVIFDLKTGKKEFLTNEAKHDYAFPSFLNEEEIVFTSDRNGIFNLYSMDIKLKKEKQLTNVVSGIFYPSVSDSFIAYSYYEDACYNIYKFMRGRERDFAEMPVIYPGEIPDKKETPEEKQRTLFDITQAAASEPDDKAYRSIVEETSQEVIKEKREYETTFTPDLVMAILGFTSDSGFMGGGYITLSDMLGNHNLSLYANIIPGYYSQIDFQYLYLSLPFDVGFRAFYNQDAYELYDASTGEFFSKYDMTQLGGTLHFKYPFSIYTSVSLNLGTSVITDKYTNYETEHTYVFDDGSMFPEGERKKIINTAAVMLYYNYSAWRDLWPYSGESLLVYAEIAEKMFGGTRSYEMYEVDCRKYFDLSFISDNNMTLSLRGLFAMTAGEDRPYFNFGGLNTIRGLYYGEYKGDRVVLMNTELRYTMMRDINLKIWPFSFLMLKNVKVAFFNDSGIVKKGGFENVVYEDVKSGFGISFVLDTFILQRQYMPLKLEAAKRTDISDDNWKFYFSIATGF